MIAYSFYRPARLRIKAQAAEELAWVQNDNRTDRDLAQFQTWWQLNEPSPADH